MTYDVRIERAALKALEKIDQRDRDRLRAAIKLLSVRPRPPGAKRLRGQLAEYLRVRVGDYRVVYTVHDEQLVVLVIKVAHRREVYDR